MMTINKQEYLNKHPYLYKYSKEEQEAFFLKLEKYQPQMSRLNAEQTVYLQDIFSTLQQLNTHLEELTQCGFSFQLGVAGGALRDVILNNSKSIGDYDITLHISNLPNTNFGTNSLSVNFKKLNEKIDIKNIWGKYFSAPDPYYIPLPTDFNEKMLTNLISAVLVESFPESIKKVYYANHEVATYQNNSIYGLLKIENISNKKPLDLIITNRFVDGFVDTFSFDLCKVYYEYNPKHAFKDMVDHIIIKHSMLNDLENKKLTMNLNHLSEENILYYMNKHYKKMKEKYPEYELSYRCRYEEDNPLSEYNEKLRSLEVIAKYHILQEKLEDNSKKVIKLKI